MLDDCEAAQHLTHGSLPQEAYHDAKAMRIWRYQCSAIEMTSDVLDAEDTRQSLAYRADLTCALGSWYLPCVDLSTCYH